jgi:hypothetical protein
MTWPVTSQSNGIRITGEALLGGRGRPLALQLFDIGGHVYRLDTPKVTNPPARAMSAGSTGSAVFRVTVRSGMGRAYRVCIFRSFHLLSLA